MGPLGVVDVAFPSVTVARYHGREHRVNRMPTRTKPTRPKEWYVAAYRSTTALLVIAAILGYLVLTKQQALIAEFQNAPASVDAPAPPTDTVAVDAPPTPPPNRVVAGWTIEEVDGGACEAGSGANRIVGARDGETPRSIALPKDLSFAFDTKRTTETRAILRSLPCGTEVLGPHPLRHSAELRLWTVDRDTMAVAPLAPADFLGCPDNLRAAFIGAEGFSFCYPNEWGATMEDSGAIARGDRVGDLYELRFASGNDVQMEAATADFAPIGSEGTPTPHRFDAASADGELRKAFSMLGTITSLRRITIGGKPGLRITSERQLVIGGPRELSEILIVIPDAITNTGTTYDLTIRGTPELAPTIDAIVATMRFAETAAPR